MMDQWLKIGPLRYTVQTCEGNMSVSDNCDEKCNYITVAIRQVWRPNK